MQPFKKLRVDFGNKSRLTGAMEIGQQRLDLIQGLLLEAGRIMEDGSSELALTLPDSPGDVTARVRQLANDATTLAALAKAAEVLLQQAPGHR